MSAYRRVVLAQSGQPLLPRARWCNTFASKLRGFTFQRTLHPDEGLVLVEDRESRLNTSIHMLFVFFDLGVIWVDEAGEVVDKVLARSWRPSYVPRAAARYVVEGDPAILEQVEIGERIEFERLEIRD